MRPGRRLVAGLAAVVTAATRDGAPLPDGTFALDTTALTVPARGTAQARLTLDPAVTTG